MKEFKELGLNDITIEAIQKKGYLIPTTIQCKTIPLLLKGEHDVIAQSQTGTGKTACFALPIIEQLKDNKNVQALILTPTRELACQVSSEIKSLKGDRKINVATIYGGASMRDQVMDLEKGSQIVVGTPGRVIDLINRKKLKISNISFAVLDEADEMLNMGFLDDIKEILEKTNTDKKMLMFSATMPKEIILIAKKFMKNYELIKNDNESLTTSLINQIYYDVQAKDRYSVIKRLVAVNNNFYGIVFCKTRSEVDLLSAKLIDDNYSAAALHGEISQGQRENILRQFKAKKLKLLIATDVAARGIDVNDLDVVINYSLPQSPEMYVHRIGRTGRAGKKGCAITFLIPSERRKLKFVEKIIDQKIIKAKIPTVQEIMFVKKEKIETDIQEILKDNKNSEYKDIAKKLLEGNEAEKVVACVLKYAFQDELNSKAYEDVIEPKKDDRGSGPGRDRDRKRSRDRRNDPRGNRSAHSRDSRSSDSKESRGSRSRDSGSSGSRDVRGFNSRNNSKIKRPRTSDSGFSRPRNSESKNNDRERNKKPRDSSERNQRFKRKNKK